MGVKERREREKQITRQAILTTSRKIVQEQSWNALTIRKVAELIEYSPSMIYEYFGSKEEILLALLREGAVELAEAMQKACLETSDEQERLFQVGEAFWQFAKQSPDLYQVMHGQGGMPLDATLVAQAVEPVVSLTLGALHDWAQANQIQTLDEAAAIDIFWALLHGLVSLAIVNRLEENRAHSLWQQALHDLLGVWTQKAKL